MAQVATPATKVVLGHVTECPWGSVTVQASVPAGVPDPGVVALTVAVKVKLAPTVGLEALSETTVVDPPGLEPPVLTVTVSVLELLLEKFPSVSLNFALA